MPRVDGVSIARFLNLLGETASARNWLMGRILANPQEQFQPTIASESQTVVDAVAISHIQCDEYDAADAFVVYVSVWDALHQLDGFPSSTLHL